MAQKFDGLELLFGDDDAQLSRVQKPSKFNGVELLFESDEAPRQQALAPAPTAPDPNAEPDAQSMIGRAVQYVRGKQDKRFKDAPAFTGYNVFDTAEGAVGLYAGATDADFSDIVRKQLGNRHIRSFKDANGFPMVEYLGEDGRPRTEYINKPGADMADVGRGIASVVPYIAGGGAVGGITRGLTGLGGGAVNVLAQGVGAGAVNVAAQGARGAAGSDQPFDKVETVGAAVGGSLGPAIAGGIGALARRFVTVPGLVDNAGQLTAKGLEVAKRAGLDPNDLTPALAKEFANKVAMTSEEAAATAVTAKPFGIPVTRGQETKNPYLLMQEEAMFRNNFGPTAQTTMIDFRRAQSQAIKDAALGRADETVTASSPRSVAPMLAPGRNPGTQPADGLPQTLGQSVRDAATAARSAAAAGEDAAWQSVPKLRATQPALADLPTAVQRGLGDLVPHEGTPAAVRMGKLLDDFISGAQPAPAANVFASSGRGAPDIDTVRRQLGALSRGAQTPEDRAAASSIYNSFNQWIDQSAEKALLSGDATAAAALRSARAYTREMREAFSIGAKTPGGQRMAKVLDDGKADTPEGVLTAILGSPGSRSTPAGVADALRSMKQVLDRYAPGDVGREAWDDLKLAYWMRQVTGRNGEMLGPNAIVANIKTAMQQQKSVIDTLFEPAEQIMMRQYMRAVERAAFTPPNASGSGYTAVMLSQTLLGRLLGGMLDKFGANTPLIRGAAELTGAQNMVGSQMARAATQPSALRATNPDALATGLMVPVGQQIYNALGYNNDNQRRPQ
jgi:hypothetical protein